MTVVRIWNHAVSLPSESAVLARDLTVFSVVADRRDRGHLVGRSLGSRPARTLVVERRQMRAMYRPTLTTLTINPEEQDGGNYDDRNSESKADDKKHLLEGRHDVGALLKDGSLALRRIRYHQHAFQDRRWSGPRRVRRYPIIIRFALGTTVHPDGRRKKPDGAFADVSDVSIGAPAFESIDEVVAGSRVLARTGGALVDVLCAVASDKSRCAEADEVVDELTAEGSVGARAVQAFVDIVLAEEPDEARQTATLEVVDFVGAGSAIQTRIDVAFVHIPLALVTVEPGRAQALVSVATVNTGPTCQQETSTVIECKQVVECIDLAVRFLLPTAAFLSFGRQSASLGISRFSRKTRIDSISQWHVTNVYLFNSKGGGDKEH